MEDFVTVDDVLNWVGSDNFHPNEFASIIVDLVNGNYTPELAKREIVMLRGKPVEPTKEIAIYWHIEDVFNQDGTLTVEEAGEVLDRIKNNHDATIGVNWDTVNRGTIDYWIDVVKGERDA